MPNMPVNPTNDQEMQRQALWSKYNAARNNILLMVIFTVLNMGLLLTNSGIYFLFSASIPYIIVDLGMFLCGKYPDEWYEGFEGMMFVDDSLFITLLIVAFIILVIYLVLWFFSKNQRVGFVIAALALFSIDTVAMLVLSYLGLSGLSLFDILFHGWVIFILAKGISAHYKLKKLPEPMIEGEFTELPADGEETVIPDSKALRPAATDVKSRVLLESEIYGHKVTYRRVKKTNELVIDGDVYDEYTALLEMPHMLKANLGGHTYAAGMDNTSSRSYLLVDGKTVITKLRWY